MDAAIFPSMFGLARVPVSSPPDHSILFKHPSYQIPAATITNPVLFKQFAKEMEGNVAKKAPSLLEKHHQDQQQLCGKQTEQQMRPETLHTQKTYQAQVPEQCCKTPSTSASTLASSTDISSAETKVPPQPSPGPAQQQPQNIKAHNLASPPASEPSFLNNQPGFSLLDASHTSDPKYVQMVSRMAAFYQQRCQAILNYQQQRCQTWATSHRQKCQESMQAAMLVVAWYIRDRIGRRRRRNKRAFRRGLREQDHAAVSRRGRPGKGETVRKWVMGIPEAALSPSNGLRDDARLDNEEREFDVEKEVVPDKDASLFTVADQMIKSQLAKIDVPLLGALNLDDSDNESQSEDETYYHEPEDYDMEEEEEEEEEEEDYDDDDEYEDDMDYEGESDDYVEDVVSKEALNGTGQGSLKRKRSESTSGVE